MKKTLISVLIVALALSLSGCSKEERSQYKEAVSLYEKGNYAAALPIFEAIESYKDSDEYLADCRYYKAMQTVSPDSSLEKAIAAMLWTVPMTTHLCTHKRFLP